MTDMSLKAIRERASAQPPALSRWSQSHRDCERDAEWLLTTAEALLEALDFTLMHVFEPPIGWYSANVFPYEDAPIEEQLERRDSGAVYVSQAREKMRRARSLADGEKHD